MAIIFRRQQYLSSHVNCKNRIKSENLRGKDQEDEFQLTFKGLILWNTDCSGGELIVMLLGTPITGHESRKRDGRMLEWEGL